MPLYAAPQNERNTSNAALIAALRNSARELIADARRYRWLKERLHGVDFNYMDADNRANSVIVFKIDDECACLAILICPLTPPSLRSRNDAPLRMDAG